LLAAKANLASITFVATLTARPFKTSLALLWTRRPDNSWLALWSTRAMRPIIAFSPRSRVHHVVAVVTTKTPQADQRTALG
jgi:hypothetical protein